MKDNPLARRKPADKTITDIASAARPFVASTHPDRLAAARPIAVNINRVHELAPWSRTTTYKLVAEGRLPARKLGRSTLILMTDLEHFINNLEEVAS